MGFEDGRASVKANHRLEQPTGTAPGALGEHRAKKNASSVESVGKLWFW